MDETQFNRFLEEFRELKDDYHQSIAYEGLRRMADQNDRSNNDPRSAGGIRLVGGGDMANDPDRVDQGFLGSMVEELKSNVYHVRLRNAMNDVVIPLYQRLELLQLENQLYNNKLHHENTLYYNAIVEAIHSSTEGVKDGFISSMILQYKMFMRHPIWNTVKAIGKNVVAPIMKGAMGLMFGFKKEESIQKKTLEAIKRQTEFLMKGEIEPSRGFFGRLVQGGLVGAVGRGLAGFYLGADKDTAQKREDQRSRGEATSGGIMGKLSDLIYKKDITQRGRTGEGYRSNGERVTESNASNTIEGEYSVITDPIIDALGGPLQQISADTTGLREVNTNMFRVMSKQREFAYASMNALHDIDRGNTLYRADKESLDQVKHERDEEQADHINAIAKYTKTSAKEAARTRRMQMFGMLANIAGSIGAMASNVVRGLTGALKGAAGMAIGASLASAFKGAGAASIGKSFATALSRVALPVSIVAGGMYLGDAITNKLKEVTGLDKWAEKLKQKDIDTYGADVSQMSASELFNMSPEQKARVREGVEQRKDEGFLSGLFGDRTPAYEPPPSTTNRQNNESLVVPDSIKQRVPLERDSRRVQPRRNEENESIGSRLTSSINSLKDSVGGWFDRDESSVNATEGNIPQLRTQQNRREAEMDERVKAQQAVQEEELGYIKELANTMKELLNIQKNSAREDTPPDTSGLLNQFSGFMSR